MPTKKAKKSAKKSRAAAPKAGAGGMVFTENAIVITLNAKDQRKAKQCLAKSGKITFSVKEHSATKLPQLLDNGKLID